MKHVRLDYWGADPVYVAKIRNAVTYMKQKGMVAQLILFNKYTNATNYDFDLVKVENEVYESTKSDVEYIMDLATDFELQNEIPLFQSMPIPENDKALNISDFDSPTGRLQAAVLRGMSKAIVDVRNETNKPLRIILGTLERRFAFLEFMQQQGVVFDVVGYHIYPHYEQIELDKDTWFGEGGALGQLAKFGKPIHINEFNSGEIFEGSTALPGNDYENKVGYPITEKGFKSFYKHLITITNQESANIESVHFYEAYDRTDQPIPENRFGLYYDEEMQKPKISLLIATSFAGGKLSTEEKELLDKRDFTYYKKAVND